jgi:hypothetical protein
MVRPSAHPVQTACHPRRFARPLQRPKFDSPSDDSPSFDGLNNDSPNFDILSNDNPGFNRLSGDGRGFDISSSDGHSFAGDRLDHTGATGIQPTGSQRPGDDTAASAAAN